MLSSRWCSPLTLHALLTVTWPYAVGVSWIVITGSSNSPLKLSAFKDLKIFSKYPAVLLVLTVCFIVRTPFIIIKSQACRNRGGDFGCPPCGRDIFVCQVDRGINPVRTLVLCRESCLTDEYFPSQPSAGHNILPYDSLPVSGEVGIKNDSSITIT